jgi:hypothetical protein
MNRKINTLFSDLIFVLCIALLGIMDQHYALVITSLFITQVPKCFGTYVPFLSSVLYPCELLEIPKWLCHRDVPCTVNVVGLCAPDVVVSCVTLSN